MIHRAHNCSHCKKPVKGHPKPWGRGCAFQRKMAEQHMDNQTVSMMDLTLSGITGSSSSVPLSPAILHQPAATGVANLPGKVSNGLPTMTTSAVALTTTMNNAVAGNTTVTVSSARVPVMATGIQSGWATVDQIADLKAGYMLLQQQQLQHQQHQQLQQETIQDQLRQQQQLLIRMMEQASQPQNMTTTRSATPSQEHVFPGMHHGHRDPVSAHQTPAPGSTPSTLPGLVSGLDSSYHRQHQQILNAVQHIPTLTTGIQNPRVFVTPQIPGVQDTPVYNGLISHNLPATAPHIMSSSAPTTGHASARVVQLPSLNDVRSCQQTRADIGHNIMDSIQHVQQPVNQGKRPNTSFFWPNEYVHRAGAPDVTFDRLTIPELVTGCIRAALESDIPDTERSARLTHVTELMVLSEQYKWDKVRALYQEYLTMIQQGRRTWQSPVRDLQQEMLRPWDQLPPPEHAQSPSKSGNNYSSVLVCNNWNYKETCTRKDCRYQHICKECNQFGITENRHKAKTCPRLVTGDSN